MSHIGAFALVVPDYDTGLAFYVGQVGFTLIEDTQISQDKRWVLIAPNTLSQTHILLAKAANTTESVAIGHQTGGRVDFFLNSDDFDADYARMKASGVFFEEDPRSEPYGKVAVWRDPWGNRWDLLQLT